MAKDKNFKWIMQDIDSTLILKVVYIKNGIQEEYGIFNVVDVLETPCDKLEIDTGNINDLTNLLTLGIVRFTNIIDSSDVLEIPFRKLYLLYKNASVLTEETEGKLIPFSELDTFSVIDGTIRNDLLLFSCQIDKVSDELSNVMKIAYEYSEYNMQEKFSALNKITEINHRRLIDESKDRTLNKYWYNDYKITDYCCFFNTRSYITLITQPKIKYKYGNIRFFKII